MMKKAVVIGGSNGIGLAICKQLIQSGYYVHVLDVVGPESEAFGVETEYEYHFFNMLDMDHTLLEKLSNDTDVKLVMVTAGIGRVAEFEKLHSVEIAKTVEINLKALLGVIHSFYARIKSEDAFYCGVMGSIAGLVSSPLFSVYAATKAGVCRFVESVNIELEIAGLDNRILNVAPGSIKGTKFNGGENDLSHTMSLANEIVERLHAHETLYIPHYDEIYKDVINRYHADGHEYGVHSYQYKKKSGREQNERKVKIGYLSGTFDLFHVGHLNLLRRAKQQCDYLIVGVHPDASHKNKAAFIPFEERMEVIGGCKYVDQVVQSCREDADAWELWHFDKLFVGSDYKGTERFLKYEKYFADKGVEIVYFPYTQGTSSTQIREKIINTPAELKK